MLALFFLILFSANIWLGWVLWSWSGIGVFLVFIPFSIIITIGGGVALGLVGAIFGKHDHRSQWKRFMRSFLRGWAWLIGLLWLSPWLLFGTIHVTNIYAPATLPRITISNGDKTVVFQSMMHIASPEFYTAVKKDMQKLSHDDYVFFYEGVKAGSPESLKKLSQFMGTDVSPEMYDILAEVAGLTFQWDESYTGILPSTNVDLTTDEIIQLAEKNNTALPAQQQGDFAKILKTYYPELTPLQKNISTVIARWVINVLLRTYTNPDLAQSMKKTIPVFDIILDERNKHIAASIQQSPNQHIYIHYGALHYAGVLKLLQEKDPRWHEINRINFRVIW